MKKNFNLLSWRLFTAQQVSGVFPPIMRSSVTAVATSGFTFISWWQPCCFRGRAGRPRTQHDCHHDTKVKPDAATAVIKLLMIGRKTPETCWAVNKRQDNKLKIVALGCWFIWIKYKLWCQKDKKNSRSNVFVSCAVFPKRKRNLMRTLCSFKSAIEKWTKTMAEAQEK
jgi:hypothetical protein